MVPKTTPRNHVSKPSNAKMIPQTTEEVDLACSERWLRLKLGSAMGDSHSLFGPRKDELVYPVHHMGPATRSGNQGSDVSHATMISQVTVAADVTHSEDPLSYAVEDCHPLSGAHQEELSYPFPRLVPERTSRHQVSELSNATMIDTNHDGSGSDT